MKECIYLINYYELLIINAHPVFHVRDLNKNHIIGKTNVKNWKCLCSIYATLHDFMIRVWVVDDSQVSSTTTAKFTSKSVKPTEL